jgi:hypothetical protein
MAATTATSITSQTSSTLNKRVSAAWFTWKPSFPSCNARAPVCLFPNRTVRPRCHSPQLRSSGFGLLNAVGRVSSFTTTYVAGQLLEVALWAPLVMAAVLLAAGSIAMLSLPEPAGASCRTSDLRTYGTTCPL